MVYQADEGRHLPKQDWFEAIFASYLLVALEWMFFVTKPSFTSDMPWLQKVLVLGATPLLFVPFILAAHAFVRTIGRLSPRSWVVAFCVTIVPAAVYLALALLLADNFMHTVFYLGLSGGGSLRRTLYLMAFVVAAVSIFMSTKRRALKDSSALTIGSACALIAFSFSSAIGVLVTSDGPPRLPQRVSVSKKWNVLVLSADGITADDLSVYGSAFPTSPFLQKFASQCVLYENAFTNASTTYASLMSIFTGKRPTESKVIYQPQILLGRNSMESLPAILAKAGYTSVQVSMRYFADMGEAGMRGGLRESNGRVLETPLNRWFVNVTSGRFNEELHFATLIVDRITDRLDAIFFVRELADEFSFVMDRGEQVSDDAVRVWKVREYIRSLPQPWFMEVHLLNSHCCGDVKDPAKFDLGPGAKPFHRLDREADDYIAQIVDQLSFSGKLDSTIVVITSDHPYRGKTCNRIPLLIRFPDGPRGVRVAANVQLIDIAPTVLAALGVDRPEWMHGSDLTNAPLPDPYRPIFASTRIFGAKRWANALLFVGTPWSDMGEAENISGSKRGMYGLAATSLVVCDRWFELGLDDGRMKSGIVPGHTGPCDASKIPDGPRAAAMIREHLASLGFAVDAAAGAEPPRSAADPQRSVH